MTFFFFGLRFLAPLTAFFSLPKSEAIRTVRDAGSKVFSAVLNKLGHFADEFLQYGAVYTPLGRAFLR